MNIIIDIILIVIIALYLFSGWRRGFVYTIMRLASFILAGLGAYLFYPIPADYAYQNIFLPKIAGSVEAAILSNSTGMSIAEILNERPPFFTDLIDKYLGSGEIEQLYGTGRELTMTDVCEFIAAPVARAISNVLCFILVFILLFIALRLVAFLLDKVCKLPVLKSANTVLGIALGLVLGLLFAWLLSAVIAGVWPALSRAYPDSFAPDMIENSVVLKALSNFNPLTLFINLKS